MAKQRLKDFDVMDSRLAYLARKAAKETDDLVNNGSEPVKRPYSEQFANLLEHGSIGDGPESKNPPAIMGHGTIYVLNHAYRKVHGNLATNVCDITEFMWDTAEGLREAESATKDTVKACYALDEEIKRYRRFILKGTTPKLCKKC